MLLLLGGLENNRCILIRLWPRHKTSHSCRYYTSLGETQFWIAHLMSSYKTSIKFLGPVRLRFLIIAPCLQIQGKILVTCSSTIFPSLFTVSSFFSAQHFATRDIIHAVVVSAFCTLKFLSVDGLDTIVVVLSTSNKSWIILIIQNNMALNSTYL